MNNRLSYLEQFINTKEIKHEVYKGEMNKIDKKVVDTQEK